MPEILGKNVGATGFGLMNFTSIPEVKPSDEDAIKAMKAAVEAGATFWNGGEFYGRPDPESNLKLIAKYFDTYPEDADKIVLSIKGGVDTKVWLPDGSKECIQKSIDTTLKHLAGKKKLDMFCLARLDPKVPAEESINAIADYIKAGKVGALCLSEVKPVTLKKVNEIFPVSAVEIEFSVWEQEAVTNGLMKTCEELKIPIIAYSPLGRGYLSGQIKKRSDVEGSNFSLMTDRYTEENLEKNWKIVELLQKLADKHDSTPANVALEYIRQKSSSPGFPVVIPIPGTTKADRAISNTKRIPMTSSDVAEIDNFMKEFQTAGHRYSTHHDAFLYQ
ncbi:putative pyridoxal reductase [Trichomonascus vanleenenianus]|uniref:aldo/keto reductase family protein n=1 Tax=Trichomonascus vanleenenianus TaxID=2268995 RepID=UPI003EC9E4BB